MIIKVLGPGCASCVSLGRPAMSDELGITARSRR
jgi:hypothetical protein